MIHKHLAIAYSMEQCGHKNVSVASFYLLCAYEHVRYLDVISVNKLLYLGT